MLPKNFSKLNLLWQNYALMVFFFLFTINGFTQTTDTYTASGSWTVPVGVTSVTVELWGAGGGGGGSATNKNGGSGGGSGAYVSRTVTVTPGNNFPFTIGTGGNGGSAADGTGVDGGNSTITIGGFSLTANGGTGGVGNEGTPGSGGTASGGTTNTPGNNGGTGGNSGGDGGDAPNGGTGGAGGTNGAGGTGNTPGGGGGGGEQGAGGAGARGEIRFTYTSTAPSYCSIGTTSSSYWIDDFSTTGGTTNINNTTTYSAGGYGDYSTQSVSQLPASSFNFDVSTSSGTHGINIWVDWNNDGDFDDVGEKVYASGGYVSTANGTITIPAAQAAGNYRMRVVANWLSTDPLSCGSTTYTEAEDYTVTVTALSACSGTPTGGTVSVSPASSGPGSSYTVTASGMTLASGMTYQWQSNTNGAGWVNVGAATTSYADHTATAPATVGTTVEWQLIVTCTNSSQNSTSTSDTFTVVSTLNVPTTGSNTVSCGTNITLYDNGGPTGDYANNADGYTVLEAGLGATINISGTYITESIDDINIYDGTGTGGTLLASYSGSSGGTINYTGTVGQTLTIQFDSDGSIVYSGFELSITYSGTCYPVCSGTPSGGTVSTTPISGGPGSSYTVSATGMTLATGMTYQWQSNTNGAGWVNEGAATTSYTDFTATAPATIGTVVEWQLIVTCTNSSQSSTSTSDTFTVVSTLNVPTTGSNTLSCGTNITLYDNGGPTGDYANNADGYTVLEAGAAGIITISGTYITESIDDINIYDGTGTGGTLLASYSGSSGGTINFTGEIGQTLTIQFDSDGSVVYSGFELSITYSGECVLSPCSGTPTGGTASVNPNTDWPGATYTVSATGYTLATDLTFQWQYSTDGGSTWTNAGGATTSYADYTATAPASGNVEWQLVVTCTNSSETANSATDTFVTMEVSDVVTGCPNVVSGGLGLSGADPAPFNCTDASTCVDLEATYLDLGSTTSYIVEPIAYNPPHAFNGLANPVSVNTDDVWSPTVNLPFDFCFYGNTYNQCLIGSNGVITFDTTNNSAGGTCSWSFDASLPVAGDTALVENSIFGVFHDINPGVSGEVGWELVTLPTGCRALIASWYDVPLFGDNSQFYTGMMVLYENSNIIEVYIQEKPNDPDEWNDNNAVVGIQNADGTLASVAPGRNGLDADWTTTNEAWRFVPNGTSIATLTWYEGSGTTGPIVGTTDVLNVCPTATTTYTAEITYTLCDGRTITELDETTVTVNGAKVWNGSVDTDWDKANNWTPVGIPTAMDCVVIPDTANDPIISGAGYNGLGLNMSIQNDAMLTVNSDNAVSITDWVNISTTGELVLDNSASLIQTNNIANTGAGNMLMDRDVNIRKLDYVYWSSPVTSFPSSSISPGSPTSLIWKWIPTVAGNGIGNSGDWVNGNENMTVGKGYIVRGPNSYTTALQNYTATFVGTPNNGDISTPITRGNYTAGGTYQVCAACTPATNLDDNWNLVGNPYPSSIHAIDFLTANSNIDGYIKVWTHGTLPSNAIADPFYEDFVSNYTIGDYITYNASGVSSGPGVFNGYIAAGQGFFVSMLDSGAASQNLNFTNSLRSNTYDNSQFYRNSGSTEKHRIWLDIVSETTSTRTLVGYIDGATEQKDRLFDAKTDNKIGLNLYSLIEDEMFTIQGRPNNFNENDIIPLGFKVPETGVYSIAIGALDGLFESTDQVIYLEDKEVNIIYDLRTSPYSFMAEEGTTNNRFNLIFKNTLTKDTNEIVNNNVWISTTNNLTIHSNVESIASIKVYDLLGRLLTFKENISSKAVSLDSIHKNNAGLILEIKLKNGSTVFKKTIY